MAPAQLTDDFPRLLDSRYRLDALLGSGGMGVVYRGLHIEIERPVAIKVLRPEYACQEDLAARFLLEARAAVRIRDEHVVEILDFGRSEDGAHYIVMELLEGRPLSSVIEAEAPFSVERSVHVAVQIATALYAAHGHGIVHRDLKPANVILLDRKGALDFVKVLDFGVAKIMGDEDSNLTGTGVVLGTADYMAPEQILGGAADPRTDVYALGVMLFLMLTGTRPFSDKGFPAMVYHHVNTEPPPLRDRQGSVPMALDSLVRRCMAKDPCHRPSDMESLRLALLEAAGDHLGGQSAKSAPDRREPVSLMNSEEVAHADDVGADSHENPTIVARPMPLDPIEPKRRTRPLILALFAGLLGVAAMILFSTNVVSFTGDAANDMGEETNQPAGPEVADQSGAMEPESPPETLIADEPETDHGIASDAPIENAVPHPASIRVIGIPRTARVFVDGRRTGSGPSVVQPSSLEPVTIRVEAAGYLAFERVVVPATDTVVLEVALRRRRRAPAAEREPPRTDAAEPEVKDDPSSKFIELDF